VFFPPGALVERLGAGVLVPASHSSHGDPSTPVERWDTSSRALQFSPPRMKQGRVEEGRLASHTYTEPLYPLSLPAQYISHVADLHIQRHFRAWN
jgi:hypothetical protein